MVTDFVAIDLETTGLNASTDRIIEVGAVRFGPGGDLGERFTSLVRCKAEIPFVVQRLTGIDPEAVLTAPTFRRIGPRLETFAADRVVVGHNIGFDLAFLRKAGFPVPERAIDTAAFARVMLPELSSHALPAVSDALALPRNDEHRALADAERSALVLQQLLARAMALPPAVRAQIGVLLGAEQPALAELLLEGTGVVAMPSPDAPGPGRASLPRALAANDDIEPITPEEVSAVYHYARAHEDGFERREEQEEMAAAITGALNNDECWLIEAGTGVGKSLAYLVPAALFALRNGRRIVVSTNTINLQEQLLTRDVPLLQRVLAGLGIIDDPGELRVATLKGRSNYLCRRRYTEMLGGAAHDPDSARLAAALVLWLSRTQTGDRGELNLPPQLVQAFHRISAQEAECLAHPNRYVADGSCFLLRARREAEAAHIVIVNHALLLADLASGGSALPQFDYLVIDEAHHLEDEATRQFGATVMPATITDELDRIDGGPDRAGAGIIPRLRSALDGGPGLGLDELGEAVSAVRARTGALFEAIRSLPVRGDDRRIPLDAGTRSRRQWAAVEETWKFLGRPLARSISLANTTIDLLLAASGSEAGEELGLPEIAEELAIAAVKLSEAQMNLGGALEDDDGRIAWVTLGDPGRTIVATAPLEVAPILSSRLFAEKRAVIATSATLAVGDSMAFSAERIGLPDANTLQLGSPFDFRRSVLLGLVRGMPPPQDATFCGEAGAVIQTLVRASAGRALVLCTSHAMVRDLHHELAGPLEEHGILVLAQGIDGNPRYLVDWLRREPRTVIIGTASLWEGVDVPGEALSLLVIPKLPFAVPTDPIHRARGALYRNPFREYTLPAAVLRFRQGFGRLIRDRGDHGAVVVLDRRIVEQSYGKRFLEALPGYTPVRADAARLALDIERWLARPRGARGEPK